jgi:LacI family transcriptional regulator
MTPIEGPPTLRHVSAASGYSTYTVSRALSNLSGVSEETRTLVLKAAAELGYVPNRMAQSLKRGASTTIGVLTANNANPFYSTLVNGFEEVVVPTGFHCIVSDATDRGHYSVDRESRFLDDLLQQRVAGVALTYPPTAWQMDRLLDWSMPIVFMDSYAPATHPDVPSIVVDSEPASFAVGEHFAQHGYFDWLFVGHPKTWSTRARREAGFNRAAREFGAQLSVIEGHNDSSDADEAVFNHIRHLKVPPRAIFAANEPLVIGTLRALRRLGLSIPDDVAVIGYDEYEWAEFASPALTVVDQSVRDIGRMAAEQLLSEISTGSTTVPRPGRALAEPTLIVRDSCGGH